MKFRQVIRIVDKYINTGQGENVSDISYESKIIRDGKKEEYWTDEKFDLLLDSKEIIKAPDDFTDKVMASILELNKSNKEIVEKPINFYPMFRRLGISMLLTAGVLLFSILGTHRGYALDSYNIGIGNSVSTEKAFVVTDTLGRINLRIKNFFYHINNSIDKFKEV